MNKWLSTFLILSLGINVFIGGYYIGTHMEPSTNVQTTPLSTHDISGVFKNLSPENLAQVKELMKKQQSEILMNQTKISQLRLQIAQVLMKEPLDQKELSHLFDETYELTSRNIALAQQTVFQTLLELPASDRIKVGRAMENATKKTTIIKIPLKNLT